MTSTATTLDPQATLTVEIATEAGVHFYSPSGRHQPLLVAGTERREHAEWILAQREEGKTMNDIVAETGWSKPKVRRMINELALTLAVEDGEYAVADVVDATEQPAEVAAAA